MEIKYVDGQVCLGGMPFVAFMRQHGLAPTRDYFLVADTGGPAACLTGVMLVQRMGSVRAAKRVINGVRGPVGTHCPYVEAISRRCAVSCDDVLALEAGWMGWPRTERMDEGLHALGLSAWHAVAGAADCS